MDKIISNGVNIEERKGLDIRSGDVVRVTQKIIEKDKKTGKPKTRLQDFEGMTLAVKHGKEAGGTITLRKVASGVGVERIFPIYSPMIEKIEVIKRSKVRRAKLYHIREKAAKEIRRQMRNIREVPEEETPPTPPLDQGRENQDQNPEQSEIESASEELKKEES